MSLCKTGAVLRFYDHGRAAIFDKVGFARGFWGEMFFDSSLGTLGGVVNFAQRGRAVAARARETESHRCIK